jgi:hypothetical protein
MSQFKPTHAFSVSSGANPVAFNPQPYGNTTTILVYNDSDTDVFLAWQDSGVTTTIDIDSGTQVPTKGSVSLAIGPQSERPTTTDVLKLDCSATSKKVNVTYVNGAVF